MIPLVLIGDIHGDFPALLRALHLGRDAGCVAAIQVGDFGFFPDDLPAFLTTTGRLPLPLHAIDGNHEDHDWLYLLRTLDRGATLRRWATHHDLHYHPRGTVTDLAGLRVAWCGGAAHADRPQEYQTRKDTAWRGPPANPVWSSWVSSADVRRTLTALKGQSCDLMVTHSCPAGIGIGMQGPPWMNLGVLSHIHKFGLDPGPDDDAGEEHLTALWRQLAHKPPLWVFGHWHVLRDVQVESTRFVSPGIGEGTAAPLMLGADGACHRLFDV